MASRDTLLALSTCSGSCASDRPVVWRWSEDESGRLGGHTTISPALVRSVGISSRLLERLCTRSGTLVAETDDRCLRTIDAARESIRLSWELHLLIGEKLLRGEETGFSAEAIIP